jgi:hypothetical protein
MVAFPGRPPTLGDGGDDQALAAADVAGREDAGLRVYERPVRLPAKNRFDLKLVNFRPFRFRPRPKTSETR